MMKFSKLLFFYLIAGIFIYSCGTNPTKIDSTVKTGAEVLLDDYLNDLEDKNIALFMNPTARIGNTHVLDTLLALDVNITALFAPEHGFRGDVGAGESIESGVDSASGIPVHSLYSGGKLLKPDEETLKNIDIVLFDMQDVGARFYTYNVSLKRLLEAAADSKHETEVWILDRPNPAGGNYVAGWILEDEHRSAVGDYPIPIAHGLTLGELAQMAVGENWLDTENTPKVKIIEMEGWQRAQKWSDTGLDWFPPSPNLPHFDNAYAYLGTCFFEGTTLSEGRGTDNPFLILGAPKTEVDYDEISKLGNKYGVKMDTLTFTPISMPGKAPNPKHKNQLSNGIELVDLKNADKQLSDPVKFGIELMWELMDKTPDAQYLEFIKKLAGTDKILDQNEPLNWGEDFDEFIEKRKKYLIYN